MSEATKVDLKTFFKPEYSKGRADRRYSDSEIAYYYKRLQAECAKHKIRFSTCYIGNGEKDFFQYQNLWTNRADCCDAKGNIPSFRSSSQDIPWSIRFKHSPDKLLAEKSMKQ